MKLSSKGRVASVFIATVVMAGIAACSSSSGPAQSNLGPFTMTSCKLGWSVPIYTTGTTGGASWNFFTSESAANDRSNTEAAADPSTVTSVKDYTPNPTSMFSITLTATADVSQFTVAYYSSSGTEISTSTAYLVGGGPNELTAGQKATFEDTNAPQGATSCQVIGSNAGNE